MILSRAALPLPWSGYHDMLQRGYTHLGLEDAVDEMNRMQQLESARKEQEALSGKTDEVKQIGRAHV